MTTHHLNEVCKPGRGAETCSYLGMNGGGFICIKVHSGLRNAIEARRKEGTLGAMGDNCEGDMDFLESPPMSAIAHGTPG